jgi:hypothetical protein
MDFYLFTSDFELIPSLEKFGFEGVLFVYHAGSDDKFTRIARSVSSDTNIKHMVAIRPYVISPQYLTMINRSMNQVRSGVLQINLISGHIKDDEKDIGGIVGPVNHYSSPEERSKYLMEYIESLEGMGDAKPDYYVSVTNPFTLETAKKYNSKIIIQYSHYVKNEYDLTNTKPMVSITPILRKTKEELDALPESTVRHRIDMANFTYDEFTSLINKIKADGIKQVILSFWNEEEQDHIINFVKQYKGIK